MWDLPGPGLEPVSPALAGGFLTIAPLGKSPHLLRSENNPLWLYDLSFWSTGVTATPLGPGPWPAALPPGTKEETTSPMAPGPMPFRPVAPVADLSTSELPLRSFFPFLEG